ncbi:MAG: hypothetical protein ACRD15_11195 [Vicinamibacterales bacterium]
MSCERFSEAITDHAAGAPIDPGAAAHLAVCRGCRRVFEEERRLLSDVDGQLQRSLAVTASPDFAARVIAGVRTTPTGLSLWNAWSMGAAAAAVIALGLYLFWPMERQRQAVSPPALVSSAPATLPRSPEVIARSTPAPHVHSSPPISGRAAATRRIGSGAPAGREPEVIVPATRARALARLRELVGSGVLDEATLPAGSAPAELVVAPLTIPQIRMSRDPEAPTTDTDRQDGATKE